VVEIGASVAEWPGRGRGNASERERERERDNEGRRKNEEKTKHAYIDKIRDTWTFSH
jgi:hypothetical protein